jgi:hypothetical protein
MIRRSRQHVALELALALESHGIVVTQSDPPVDIPRLAAALAERHAAATDYVTERR